MKSLLAPGRVHFLYSSRGRPDPMLIPWVHIEIISMERLNEAQSLLQAADRLADPRQKEVCYKLALEELKRVQAEDTTGRYAEKAKEIEKRVNDLIRQIPAPGATPTPVATKRPELPQEIVANTRGVVYDETPKRDHVVLIADEVLRVNQSPRGHPEVRIARIERGAVTFVFDSTSATITVETEVSFGRR
ncbi:hypothetical protein FJY63_13440 [Candidatus Sumerlaeota bacterium]|nr:hypothetical protein [Candidatus Sumerlaeota bacterium]